MPRSLTKKDKAVIASFLAGRSLSSKHLESWEGLKGVWLLSNGCGVAAERDLDGQIHQRANCCKPRQQVLRALSKAQSC